jgi:hypothetical protein
MAKPSKSIASTSAVQKRLLAMHAEFRTWELVAANLGLHYGEHLFSRAYLCRVAKGEQKASKRLLFAVDEYRRATRPNKPQPPAWVTVAADWLAARERLTDVVR